MAAIPKAGKKRKANMQEFDRLIKSKCKPKATKDRNLLPLIESPPKFTKVKKASILEDYNASVPIGHRLENDALTFLDEMKPGEREIIIKKIETQRGIKFTLSLEVLLQRFQSLPQVCDDDAKPEVITETAYLTSMAMPILNQSEIDESLEKAKDKILKYLETYMKESSGWQFKRCVILDIRIAEYWPFRGKSYFPTPTYIPPRSVINVKNKDNRCFEWAILSALHQPFNHRDKAWQYKAYLGKLNFAGIEFPVKVTDVTKFELQNPSLSVNIFVWKDRLYPIHISKATGRAIDLLLMTDHENPENNHYVWIKNLGRMLFKNSKYKARKHPCRRCLHVFSAYERLEAHKKDCSGIGIKYPRTVMPEKDKNVLKFENHHKSMRAPYIIYADFEVLNIPVEGATGDHSVSNTRLVANQIPCSYCYVVVRCDGKVQEPILYRGENAVGMFLDKLQDELCEIRKVLEKPAEMILDINDQQAFLKARVCCICSEKLSEDRFKDHCHITGKYRGAAHKACNLKLRIYANKTKIPVVFHNLQGYGGHLIMSALGKSDSTERQKICCIPNTMDTYMTFNIGQLQFIDSLKFMNSSLEKLVANLQTENLKITSKVLTAEKLALVQRKVIYPSGYINSVKRFDELQLPSKKDFYSTLRRETISDEDYNHAHQVWKIFGCKTLGDYHDLYLTTDVLLLANVFETFRDTSKTHYGLDPANYTSTPGMSYDALLKITKVKLELLTDMDKYLFIERGLRGGISMVSKRFAEANNQKCQDYDKSKSKSWVIYLDANNLYGWAMEQLLPVCDCQWVNISIDQLLDNPDDSNEGYVVEVDIEYPENLHDAHSDYPLAPEAMSIHEEWLSDYQRTLVNELGSKFTDCVKLVPNLRNKERYVVHYRNLKLYKQLGMKVTKIHRALRFRQEAWMTPYIQLNTNLRKEAKSEFEKDFFKLMNNSVFGKTIENLRKRIRVDLVRTSQEDKLRKLVADPAYRSHKIFAGNLIAIHRAKSKLTLNRPVYVGQAILDLSKHLMYDFWYNQIKSQYGSEAQLLYTDTDSLLMLLQTEDAYDDMKKNATLYDFSDYDKKHRCYSTANKKVVGKFKDACAGLPIAEFVGLRPKMYSILMGSGEEIKKANGVPRVVVENDLRHNLYKQCLFEHVEMKHKQVLIRNRQHQMGLFEQNKKSLSSMDTKKWIAQDGITTRGYGHYLTEREELAQ